MNESTGQSQPAWGQPSSPTPAAKSSKVKLVVAGAALFLLGMAVGAAGNSKEEEQPAAQAATAGGSQQKLVPATTATTAAPVTTTTQPPTTTTTLAPTTTTTAAPKWTTVARLTGTGDKLGPMFALQGGQQRIKYSCSMPSDGYVGGSRFDVGGSDFSCETEEGKPRSSGDSMLYEDAGSYHFEINATPNNTWSISIEELR